MGSYLCVDLYNILLTLKRKRTLLFAGLYLLFLSTAVFLFRIGTPPAEGIEVYKGCNIGWFLPSQLMGNEAREMKESGVNLVASTWPIFIDSSGNPPRGPLLRATVDTADSNCPQKWLEILPKLEGAIRGSRECTGHTRRGLVEFFPEVEQVGP